MDWLIQDAWAQQVPGATDPLLSMLPFLLIFVVFYFLLIRPQNKQRKEHKEMVEKLAVGDEVVTSGGVLGKVAQLSDKFVHLEVADGVTIKIQRHTVGAVLLKGTLKDA
jgi:preprotein translocase subunit YajC